MCIDSRTLVIAGRQAANDDANIICVYFVAVIFAQPL
jgi:hypothetical protein